MSAVLRMAGQCGIDLSFGDILLLSVELVVASVVMPDLGFESEPLHAHVRRSVDEHRQILPRQSVEASSEGIVVEIRRDYPFAEYQIARHPRIVPFHSHEREFASEPHHRAHHTLGTHARTQDPPGPVIGACRVYQLPDSRGFREGHDDRAHGVETLVGLLPVIYLQSGTDDAHTLTLQRQAGWQPHPRDVPHTASAPHSDEARFRL